MSAIDLDRGVTIRFLPGSGERICQYKDDVGHYFDWRGKPVSEEQARAAGFDVDRDKLIRLRTERRAAAIQEADERLAAELKSRGLEPPPAAPQQNVGNPPTREAQETRARKLLGTEPSAGGWIGGGPPRPKTFEEM